MFTEKDGTAKDHLSKNFNHLIYLNFNTNTAPIVSAKISQKLHILPGTKDWCHSSNTP